MHEEYLRWFWDETDPEDPPDFPDRIDPLVLPDEVEVINYPDDEYHIPDHPPFPFT